MNFPSLTNSGMFDASQSSEFQCTPQDQPVLALSGNGTPSPKRNRFHDEADDEPSGDSLRDLSHGMEDLEVLTAESRSSMPPPLCRRRCPSDASSAGTVLKFSQSQMSQDYMGPPKSTVF